jgi:DNA polymerase
MSVLSIDFETRSTIDLRKTGVYPYAAHATTDIWCMAYAFDDEPVGLMSFAANEWWGEQEVGDDIIHAVEQGIEVRAWNAQFERIIWNDILAPRYGFPPLVSEQVFDTAADAAALALPRGLAKAAQVLGLDTEKDMEGHRLMMQMAKPRKPPKDDPTRLWWWDDEERRGRLYEYCETDVEVERAIGKRIRKLSDHERKLYLLDQKMNDRGVMIDVPLVVAAQEIVKEGTYRANLEISEVTGGEVASVTKVKDLTRWLQYNGLDVDNVRKDTLRDLLGGDLPDDVRRALEIRASAGKTSTAKLSAMLHAVGDTERACGLLLFHGASTGRWSGKLLQPQNFPRPTINNVEHFINDVLEGNYDVIDDHHPPIVVVSSMLRSMLRAAPGHHFKAGDFAQIEARVLAWIAEQNDMVEAFAKGSKVYEEMAAFIYGVPVSEIENPSERRQVGKNTILGAGYQMGPKRFKDQAKEQSGMDISEEESKRAIDGYREKNYRIKAFWNAINTAAMKAVSKPGTITSVGRNDSVRFVVRGDFLWCQLPSKRFLAYAMPSIREKRTPWGEMRGVVSYMGVDGMTRQWRRHYTYGGHLTENVVSAIARDLLAAGIMRLDDAGYRPLLTVHDEVISEPPNGHGSMEEFLKLLTILPRWAEDLPVAADGWEGERYRK